MLGIEPPETASRRVVEIFSPFRPDFTLNLVPSIDVSDLNTMNIIAFRNFRNDFFFKNRRIISIVFGFAGSVCLLVGKRSSAGNLFMKSHRTYGRDIVLKLMSKFGLLNEDVLSRQYSLGVSLEEAAGRSIVVKYPSISGDDVLSKGIIIIKFTKTFSFYLHHIDIDSLADYFHIVLEPSWSGYLDADILGWMHKTNNFVYVQATEIQDRILLNALHSNLKPVSFGASDWVDYKHFSPDNVEKLYDSIYVANTNPIKRIARYLEAIRNIKEEVPDYKACLVCAMWGDNPADQITRLATQLGIDSNVDFMFALNRDQLRTALTKSKTNILLSYKEGSNRSLFESMFVDVPAICLAENIGTNKAYINEYTGILITNSFLEEALIDMKNNWAKFSPRKWALKNISPMITTHKLLRIIESYDNTEISGKETYIKVNNPELRYFHDQDIEFQKFNTNLLQLFLTDPDKTLAVDDLKLFQNDYNALFGSKLHSS